MKKIILINFHVLFTLITYSQVVNKMLSTWITYEGKLVKENNQTNIQIRLLFLNEGWIDGTFKEPENNVNHKIVGQQKNDSLSLTIRNLVDILEGFWTAKIYNDTIIEGIYYNINGTEIGKICLSKSNFQSYTDFLI